jgi:hypothetical protein
VVGGCCCADVFLVVSLAAVGGGGGGNDQPRAAGQRRAGSAAALLPGRHAQFILVKHRSIVSKYIILPYYSTCRADGHDAVEGGSDGVHLSGVGRGEVIGRTVDEEPREGGRGGLGVSALLVLLVG